MTQECEQEMPIHVVSREGAVVHSWGSFEEVSSHARTCPTMGKVLRPDWEARIPDARRQGES